MTADTRSRREQMCDTHFEQILHSCRSKVSEEAMRSSRVVHVTPDSLDLAGLSHAQVSMRELAVHSPATRQFSEVLRSKANPHSWILRLVAWPLRLALVSHSLANRTFSRLGAATLAV
jgi:hypothetical protein